MFEYNTKIDYLFAKRLIKNNRNIDELHKRGVFNGTQEPKNNYDRLLKSLKTIIEYIKNEETKFNIESVKNIINLLYINKKYKVINDEELLEEMICNFADCPHPNNVDLFSNLFINMIFDSKIEFYIIPIIYNFTRIKEEKSPLIFRYEIVKRIRELLTKKENLGVLSLFSEMYIEVDAYNTVHKDISLKEIKKKIVLNEEYLKNELYVNSLYIYGSYAKGTETKYSDIDIYLTTYSKIYNKLSYTAYFSKLLELPVDISISYKDNLNGLKASQRKYLEEVF